MPHLVRWNDELSDAGLVVLGLHVQKASQDDVKAKCRGLGIRFPVTAGGSVDGNKSGGIPHCFLFDHEGKLAFDGHPKDVEAKLRDAVAERLVGDSSEEPTKAIATALAAFRKGGTPLDLLKKMNTLSNDGEPKTAKAAKAISAKLQSGAQARLDDAKAQATDDPIAAYDSAVTVAARWKGTNLGRGATDLVEKLKGNKLVAGELKARPTLDKLRTLDEAMTKAAVVRGDLEPGTPEFKKAFAKELKQVETTVATMKKSFPDAPATKQAEEIADRLKNGLPDKKDGEK